MKNIERDATIQSVQTIIDNALYILQGFEIISSNEKEEINNILSAKIHNSELLEQDGRRQWHFV